MPRHLMCALLLSALIPALSLGGPDVTPAGWTEAVAWASRGDVKPYPLLSLPSARQTRHEVGRVFTPFVRLALSMQTRLQEGRALQAQLPASVTDSSVVIVWSEKPRLQPMPDVHCTDPVGPWRREIALRPSKGSARSEVILPATAVSFDDAANHAFLQQMGDPFAGSDRAELLIRLSSEHLLPDTLLIWRESRSCDELAGVVLEAFALITADDLSGWHEEWAHI